MDSEEKIKRLEELLPDEPNDSLTHFLLGREYMEVKRYDDAARVLERCVELNPTYTAAWRFLGDACRFAGKTDEARRAYETGITVAQDTGDLQTGKEMEALLRRLDK